MKHLILLLIIGALLGCYGTEPQTTGQEGKPLPSFKLLLPDSLTYIDTKDVHKGKPVVLFYFGPYCSYSRSQMEEIAKDMNTLKDIQFYVFTYGPFDDMKKFCTHYNLKKYPNIITGLDYSNFFPDYFKATGVPFIAIYGKDGMLSKAYQGKIPSERIKKAIAL